MDLVPKILPRITITIPEVVAAEPMLDPSLELPDVGASVGAGLHADPGALAAGPLAGVAVAAVEPVGAEAVPQPSAVVAPVPAPLRPALDPVAVVLPTVKNLSFPP